MQLVWRKIKVLMANIDRDFETHGGNQLFLESSVTANDYVGTTHIASTSLSADGMFPGSSSTTHGKGSPAASNLLAGLSDIQWLYSVERFAGPFR
jgi:hypothetical protein